jgi:quercetin dioxygenase-like cupin family protein
MTEDVRNQFVQSVTAVEAVQLSWGNLAWLVDANRMEGAEQAFGVVTIDAGQRNPLHRHPNCEELLYVLQGTADHTLGDDMVQLKAGDIIRIPRGVPHYAQATGDGPLVAVISFSSGNRQTENLDGTADIA